ncbi:hypothetical protein HAX54_016436, partial [Datura stramonium]|nr:hypothetical protein [Datura stramonium]
EDWVLCRVFYKGTKDEKNINSTNNESTSVTSLNIMDNHEAIISMPIGGYRQSVINISSNSIYQSQNSTNGNEIIHSKCGKEDEFGFLFDMNYFEESNLQDGGVGFGDENSL